MNPFHGLNGDQSLAFLSEIESARNLLGYGVHALRTSDFDATMRDPIFTLLSIGVEKLYKLTLGVLAVETEGRWPTKQEMRERGHALGGMHEAVFSGLGGRAAGRTEFVRETLGKVADDPVVEPLIRALDVYGRQGRFYYLDQLGEAPQAVHPNEQWNAVESAAWADPHVGALYSVTMADFTNNMAWEEFHQALRGRIADAVVGVWTAVAVCGRNHTMGPLGRTFGFEVHPDAVGRQQTRA